MSIVCGLLGRSAQHRLWLHYWKQIRPDAVLVKYPTTSDTLLLRLSEMYVHDRQLYFLAENLQSSVLPLLDSCSSALPNVLINKNGCIHGLNVQCSSTGVQHVLNTVDSL
jgi:hypothetical protein